jgi:hypothetical protein
MLNRTPKFTPLQKDVLRQLVASVRQSIALDLDKTSSPWGEPLGYIRTNSTTTARSRALAQLEARGFVLRQGSHDFRNGKDEKLQGRCSSVVLTPSGRRAVEQLEAEERATNLRSFLQSAKSYEKRRAT